MPSFKAFGVKNLQYEIRICLKIDNRGTMSQWQIQVTIFLSGTDVTYKIRQKMHDFFDVQR